MMEFHSTSGQTSYFSVGYTRDMTWTGSTHWVGQHHLIIIAMVPTPNVGLLIGLVQTATVQDGMILQIRLSVYSVQHPWVEDNEGGVSFPLG